MHRGVHNEKADVTTNVVINVSVLALCNLEMT